MITPYIFVGAWMPTNWYVYSLTTELADWVNQQPEDMWIRVESTNNYTVTYKHPYALSPKLESWMKLKWG